MDPTRIAQEWDRTLREASKARILKGLTWATNLAWATNLVRADPTNPEAGLTQIVHPAQKETWIRKYPTAKSWNQISMKI